MVLDELIGRQIKSPMASIIKISSLWEDYLVKKKKKAGGP